jgi:nucleoside-diphosphate-sugar epimerase
MRFLVTGGTGFVGSHMVELLLKEGHEVVCPVRSLSALRNLADIPATIVTMDRIEETLAHGPAVDYVIHLAASTRSLDYEGYRKANVDYTRMLLQHFAVPERAQALKRFVLISSQAVAGPSNDGAPVKESDPPRPVSLYGHSKLEAEELVASFGGRLPVTVIRPPTVFGPRDVDVLGVFRTAKFGFVTYIAGPDRLVSIVYVEDLVNGILKAALSSVARDRAYYMANPEPVVWKDFSLLIARILGCRAVAIPVPLALMRILSAGGDILGRVRGKAVLFRSEKLVEMEQLAWVCSSERAYRELQWKPRVPLDEAIRKTAQWYKDNKWL